MFKMWGFEKYLRQHEWDSLGPIAKKRKADGKDTEATVDEKFVTSKRVDKRLRRPDPEIPEASTFSERSVAIDVRTPPSGNTPLDSGLSLSTPSGIVTRPTLSKLPLCQTWHSILSIRE